MRFLLLPNARCPKPTFVPLQLFLFNVDLLSRLLEYALKTDNLLKQNSFRRSFGITFPVRCTWITVPSVALN